MVMELTYGIVRHYLYTVEIVPSTEWIKVMNAMEAVKELQLALDIYESATDGDDLDFIIKQIAKVIDGLTERHNRIELELGADRA